MPFTTSLKTKSTMQTLKKNLKMIFLASPFLASLFTVTTIDTAHADEFQDTLVQYITNPATAFDASDLPGSQNDGLYECQSLFSSYLLSTITSFVTTPPHDLAYTLAAHGSQLGLKHCKPQIVAPDNLVIEKSGDNVCVGELKQEKISGMYQNILGFDRPADIYNWGDLSRDIPLNISHRNTSVYVEITNFPFDSAYEEDPITVFALPAGRYDLNYRADTLIAEVDKWPFYIPKVPKGTGRWSKFVSKNPKVAKNILRFRGIPKSLNRLRSALGASGLESSNEQISDLLLFFNPYPHSFFGYPEVFNEDTQSVFVFDQFNPTMSFDTNLSNLEGIAKELLSYDTNTQTYYVEAISPAGIDRQMAVPLLQQFVLADDRCDRGPLVSLTSSDDVGPVWPIGQNIALTWKGTDAGPSNIQEDRRTVSQVMSVQVRDTKPPIILAPQNIVIPIAPGGNTGLVSPGVPRVFDLADFDVAVSNNAGLNVDGFRSFSEGLTEIIWTATDSSTNTADARQLIVAKDPTTNTAPQATSQTGALAAQTKTFQPIDIILQGIDPDTWFSVGLNKTVNEPIIFELATMPDPEKGFFKAELTPYFIEDYRVGAQDFSDPMQQDPEEYCRTAGQRIDWEVEYPFHAEWMTIDDNHNTYVVDLGSVQCDSGDIVTERRRVLKIAANGDLSSTELDETPESPKAFFWDNNANAMFASYQGFSGVEPRLVRIDSDLSKTAWSMDQTTPQSPELLNLLALAADVNNDFLIAYDEANSPARSLKIFDLSTATNTWPPQYDPDLSFEPEHKDITSMTLDADGNLYTANENGRIYKYQLRDEQGDYLTDNQGKLSPIFVGWMGRCLTTIPQDSAPLCNEDQYPNDEEKRHSYGFVCKDHLCAVPKDGANDDITQGTEIGQFTSSSSNAMDISFSPDNVMYVAETSLNRVQRFTADGFPAGVASSTGAGFGFLLGDFDDVSYIETNSERFFLLDANSNLLHSFKTTPLTPVDQNADGLIDAAKVTYQSNTGWPEGDSDTDSFTFTVSDGIATSAPATVEINVSRNYRPPEIPDSDPFSVEVDEDGTFPPPGLGIDFEIRDLDFQDKFNLGFIVERAPEHGEVLLDSGVRYIPDPDFNGLDSFSLKAYDGSTPLPGIVGVSVSEESKEFSVLVNPLPDAPSFETDEEDNLIALFGYDFSFSFTAIDPDELLPGQSVSLSIAWGDGASTQSGVMLLSNQQVFEYIQGSADIDIQTARDGSSKIVFPNDYPEDYPNDGDSLANTELALTSGPLLLASDGSNISMQATHAYNLTGDQTIQVCQTISESGEADLVSCDNDFRIVAVQQTPSLNLFVQPAVEIIKAGDDVSFNITITNPVFDLAVPILPGPENFADNVFYNIQFQEDLNFISVTPQAGNCSAPIDGEIRCELEQALSYNESVSISLELKVDDNAEPNERYGVIAEATMNPEIPSDDDITNANYFVGLGALEVGLDSDGDGVFDTLDAFPYLADFQVDSDGDGIADVLDTWPNDPRYSSGGRIQDTVDDTTNSNDVETILKQYMLPQHSEVEVSFTILAVSGAGGGGGSGLFRVSIDGQVIVENLGNDDLPYTGTVNLQHSNPNLELRFEQIDLKNNRTWGVQGIEIRWDPNDADGDGLNDDVDPLPMDADLTQMDSDKDGDNDAVDNCPADFNPIQENNDMDLMGGDACDDDDDNDGVQDLAPDNCQFIANTDQLDTDSDLYGDACDDDDDNDNVDDIDDNCPLIANENQADSNNDGRGDLCPDQTLCFPVVTQADTVALVCL